MSHPTLKTKYNTKNNKFHATVGFWVDQVKLKLQITEKTLQKANEVVKDVELSVERPGHFIIEHHLHKNHTRFQFHSHADVLSKPVKLTFVHHIGPNVTSLEASSVIENNHKLIVKQNFSKNAPLLKYEFTHDGLHIEPQFDFGAGSQAAWGLSLKKTLGKREFVKAAYLHHKREAELELSKSIDDGGPLKVIALLDTSDFGKGPTFVLEKEWHF